MWKNIKGVIGKERMVTKSEEERLQEEVGKRKKFRGLWTGKKRW